MTVRPPPRVVTVRRHSQQGQSREADQEGCPLGHMGCPHEAGDAKARIPSGLRDGRAEALDDKDGTEQPQQP